MVTFNKINNNKGIVKYQYFPEGNEDSKPGIIVLDTENERLYVLEAAEEDIERNISASELNTIKEEIDKMREEAGRVPTSVNDELEVATEAIHYYVYAHHAMSRIAKAYKENKILDEGVSMWY